MQRLTFYHMQAIPTLVYTKEASPPPAMRPMLSVAVGIIECAPSPTSFGELKLLSMISTEYHFTSRDSSDALVKDCFA